MTTRRRLDRDRRLYNRLRRRFDRISKHATKRHWLGLPWPRWDRLHPLIWRSKGRFSPLKAGECHIPSKADRRFEAARKRWLSVDNNRQLLTALAEHEEDPMVGPCPQCGKAMTYGRRPVAAKWRGVDIDFESIGWFCDDCGEAVFDGPELERQEQVLKEKDRGK